MQPPIWMIQTILMVLSVALALLALRMGQRLAAGLALAGLLMAFVLFGFGPPNVSARTSDKAVPPANHGPCAFGDVYKGLSDVLGQPVGPVTELHGFLTVPLEYGWLQCDPRIEDVHWRTGMANISPLLMEREQIEPDSQPVLPQGLLTLIASQSPRLDTFWLYGNPLTGPRVINGRCLVFYQKAVFAYECGSPDYDPAPSEISKERVGQMMWQALNGKKTSLLEPEPWTPTRLVVAGASAFLLLTAGVASWWGRRTAFE